MLSRRELLTRTAGFAVMGLPLGKAAASGLTGIEKASMRGSINATELGVQPGALDDQSKAFARLLRDANDRDMPVFLPPGTYVVSNLALPTIVSGNHIERIRARSGGAGQNGNGINAFRAGNVVISGNIVSDCAFSTIRAKS